MPGGSTLSVSVLGASPFRVDEAPTGFDVRRIDRPTVETGACQVVVAFGGARLVLGFDPGEIGDLGSGAWPGVSQRLSAVSSHRDAGPGIRRYRFAGAPTYSAMHVVDDAADVRPDYCDVHVHPDEDELNVLLPGDGGLTYSIYCQNRWWEVTAPAVVWAPAGAPHSATAVRGSGVFFMMRVPVSPDAAA